MPALTRVVCPPYPGSFPRRSFRIVATDSWCNVICIASHWIYEWVRGGSSTLPPSLLNWYLFLCPLADFQPHLLGRLGIPDCPAYWSLDPSGAERLTGDEASALGFPDIHCLREVWGKSWDDDAYAAIRQFQEAKGFNPYSQEAAIAIGYPLLEMACDGDALFAHLNASGESFESDVEEYYDFTEGEAEPESTPAGSAVYAAVGEDDEAGTEHETNLASEDEPTLNYVNAKSIVASCNPDAQMFAPCQSWNIIMSVQFALLLILGSFSLYDFLC
ncbi:hypothetical protein DFH06DRAFT_1415654 [Mycena polygramma]|nr:hypothetical protein DFH06DRAFT_1415654 [Mycena polygramma]